MKYREWKMHELLVKSFAQLKLYYRTSNLQCILLLHLLLQTKTHLLVPHQRTKLRLVVVYQKVLIQTTNYRMLPRHRYVCYTDLTLVAPTYLYALNRRVLDHHDTLFLLTGSLQYYIVSLGFLYPDHFPGFRQFGLVV